MSSALSSLRLTPLAIQVPYWCQATSPSHLKALLKRMDTEPSLAMRTSPISLSPSLRLLPSQSEGTASSITPRFGFQVDYPIPSAGVFLKGAIYKEVSATAGIGAYPKGALLRLTLVKVF